MTSPASAMVTPAPHSTESHSHLTSTTTTTERYLTGTRMRQYPSTPFYEFRRTTGAPSDQLRKHEFFQCELVRIKLFCRVGFFGAKTTWERIAYLSLPRGICKTAIESKTSPYGPLIPYTGSVWKTKSSPLRKCKWMKTVHISHFQLTIRITESWERN